MKKHTQIATSLILLAVSAIPSFIPKALGQSPAKVATLPQLVVQSGHTGGVLTSAFSPDSKLIATGGRDNAIRIWDVKTGRLIRTMFGHTDPILSLNFNSDSTELVSGAMDDLVITWDIATGNQIQKYVNKSDTVWLKSFGYNAVEQVGFAPDKSIFAIYTDGSLICWMPKGEQIAPLLRGFEPTENYLPIQMHKTQAGRIDGSRHGNVLKPTHARAFLIFANGKLPAASFASDLHCMAVAIPSQHALVCNTFSASGSSKDWTLKDTDASRPPVAFAFTKPIAAVEIHSKLYTFDLVTGKKLKELVIPMPTLSGDPKIQKLLNRTPKQMQEAGLEELGQSERVDGIKRFSCAFSPDDSKICVSDSLALDSGKTATIFDTTSGQMIEKLTGHAAQITSVEYSPDGKTIATTSEDKTIRLWDSATGTLKIVLGRPNNAINVVAFSPDSAQIVAGSENGSLYFWKPKESSEPERLKISKSSIECLRFSKDGAEIATGCEDSCVHVTRVADRKTSKRMFKTQNSVGSLAFPAGAKELCIATEREHSVSNYDLNSGKKIAEQFLPGLADRLTTSLDGRKLALGNGLGDILIFDTKLKKIVKTIKAYTPYAFNDEADIYLWAIAFSSDGKLLAASDDLGNAKIWDAESGALVQTLPRQRSAVSAFAFAEGNAQITTGTTSGDITIFDLSNKQKTVVLGNLQNKITSLTFNKDNSELVSACENGLVTLWDVGHTKQLCGMIALPENQSKEDSWAVITPQGRFDTNNLEQISSLAWVLPEDPLHALPPEIFLRQYFEPNLLPRLIKKDQFSPLPDLQKLKMVQPTITKLEITANKEIADQVDVSVSFKSSDENRAGTEKVRSGVYDLRLFRDGQLVGQLSKDNAQQNSESADLTNGSNHEQTHKFTVKLPHNGSSKFTFAAYAFNSDKVKSDTKTAEYELKNALTPKKGRAYVIAVGVNDFADKNWNLTYAAADARAYCGDGKTKSQLVADLEAILALSGKAPLASNTAKQLHELGLRQADPEDFVLLSFATHGATDKDTGEFYLFPSDICETGKSQNAGLTADLKSHGISSTELTDWLKDLDVSSMTMIIDACHSGAASGKEFKPGPMDSPGLGQLAYYKKMRLLFASQAASTAQERESLGHGLLTYALLQEGLSADGRADSAPKDRVVKLTEWLKFARDEVPRLDSSDSANKRDLTLDTTSQQSNSSLQTPSLLDFSRKSNDVTIFKVEPPPKNGAAPPTL
ncbi:MAG: caspase family protein [Candidatus Melainabacteria bacterium]|nr:caspase family protein [Candidatus Melainabacteria bacterium]